MADDNRKAEILAVFNATGIREGVADGKAAIKDFADTVNTESTKANRSLASLGGGSVVDNITRLDKAFADVGESVEKSLDKADRATKSFVTKIRQSAAVAGSVTQETVDKLAGSLFNNKKVDASTVLPYIAALQKLADENTQLKAATDAQTASQGKANTAAAAAAAQFSNFERSAQAARIELLSFGKTAAEKFEIRATLTGLDKNAATQQIIADLKAAEAAAVAAGKGIGTGLQQPLERVGMSAKATAAALRQVPAQFTDIIVSLQGGQAPLTVLLQQGGQLKDVFGGIGPAAQALGGYIAGLINPFTLAAGAAALLAVAYNQGSKEADAYSKALILTGNAAGVTAGRLAAMAQSIGAATGGTVGAAAEAVAAFASSGNIAASQIEKFSATAIGLQKTMGIAVGDTVKQFEELGKEPVKASTKLNETTRFLTLSVYEQIKALEDQGRVAEAGALAQNAYDAAMKTRIGAIKDNLGLLEKAWAGVKKQAALAWDDMLGVGRKADPVKEAADTLKAAQEKLAQIKGDSKGATGYSVGGYATDIAAQEKVVAELKKQVDYNAAIESSKGRSAAHTAREAKLLESKIGFDREGLEFATTREKREKAIAEQTAKYGDLLKQNIITQKQFDALLANTRDKFKDPVGKKGTVGDPFEADRSAAKEWAKFYEDFTKLAANAKGEVDDLSKSEKKWLEYLESPAWANATNEMRDLATAQAYAAIVAEDAAKVEKDYEKQIKASTAAHLSLVNAQDKRTENAQEQLQKQLASNAAIGLSADAVGELEAANILLTAAELERKANLQDGVMLSAELIDKYREEAAVLRNLAEAKRIGGAKKAANEAADDWKKAAEKINDSITDALLRGFESGKGFAENLRDTVVNMFKTMVLRPVISAVIGGVTGFSGAANAAGLGGDAAGAFNLANAASSGMGWLTDFGGSAANSIGKFGPSLSGELDVFGMASNELAGNIQMIGDGLGYLNAAVAASEGKWGKAIGSGVGTYFGGPIGAAIGSAVGGFVDSAFGGGKEYTTGTGIKGRFSGDTFAGSNYQNVRNDGSSGFFGIGASGASEKTNTSALDPVLQRALATAFGAMQTQTEAFAKALGLSTDGIAGYAKDITVAFGADAEANKKAIETTLAQVGDDLAGSLFNYFTSSFKKTLSDGTIETSSTALARLATGLTVVNDTLKDLGLSLFSVSLDGAAAASNLIDAFGGLQNYTTKIGSYFNNFYSDAEKRSATLTRIAEQLNAQGVVGTADDLGKLDRAGYRDLVDAAALSRNSESGAKLYATLVSLSDAFASVTPAVKEAEAAVSKYLEKLQADSAQLGVDLLTAQGKTTGANAAQKAIDTTGYSAAEVALYDYNVALREQITTLDQATEAAEREAEIRLGFQQRFDVLGGVTTARQQALQADLASTTDATTQALIKQVYAQEDAATAAETAAAALSKAADTLRNTLQAALDASRAGVADAVSAVRTSVDAQKALVTTAYNTQAEAISKSLDTVGGSIGKLQSLSGNLKSTLDGMRIVGGEAAYRAAAQAQITAALSTARAGGGLPVNGQLDNALRTVSQSSEELFGSFAEYAFDFQRTFNDIAALGDLTATQLTGEELTQSLLKTQADNLKAGFDAELKRLDNLVTAAQTQADAATKATTAMQSLADAINAFTASLGVTLSNSLATAFETYDSNSNGGIGFEEFAAAFGGMASEATLKALFDKTDLNGNGQISQLEAINANTANLLARMVVTGTGGTVAGAANYTGTQAAQAIKDSAAAGVSVPAALNAANVNLGVSSGSLAQVADTINANQPVKDVYAQAISEYQRRIDATAVLSTSERDSFIAAASQRASANGTSAEAEFVKYLVSIGWNAGMGDKAMGWPSGATNAWATANGFPAFERGINYLPNDTMALLHEGEAVIPKAYNPYKPGAQGSNARLESLVEGLTAEVQRLQAIVNDGNTHTRRTADAVNGNPEMPMLVETV